MKTYELNNMQCFWQCFWLVIINYILIILSEVTFADFEIILKILGSVDI